jgi:hypothetical protein
MTGGRSPPQLCFSLFWLDSSSTAAALTLRSLCSALFGPPRLMHRTRRKPLRWSGTHGAARAWRHSTSASGSDRQIFWTALSERQGGLEFSWAAKPRTDTFGHESALVARTCSPAKLLGLLKFVRTPRCNDTRRCHPCPCHRPDALAAMALRRTSEQRRRVSICTDRQQRNAGKRGACGTADRCVRIICRAPNNTAQE